MKTLFPSKHPLVYGIRGCFVLGMLLAGACSNDLKEIEATAAYYAPAVERGEDITLIYNEEGHKKVKLEAPVIIQHKLEEPYIEFPKGLNVWFYNDSLETTSTLSAQYAIRYEQEEKTVFRDSVIIVNEMGEKVYTEEMTWDEQAEKVYSDALVRIVTPDKRITGHGFEANQSFTEYVIKEITGQVYVQSNSTDENL